MIPELGNFALSLAAAIALIQFVVPLQGLRSGNWRLISAAPTFAILQFVLVLIAFIALSMSFANNDFSVAYVAEHSNSLLPLRYRLSAVWGGHEGSLLLWVLLLSGWTLAVALLSKNLPALTRARVLSILGVIALGFLIFILFTSNPFTRYDADFPLNGADLNPLLQDPGMVVHPPMLYMGYVGFSVAFAFAIAALLEGSIDALWARWVRPWTLAAWLFLGLGITLGSWWAYYELGWGGWWFWDPVENASFMPWLLGTALLHSLAATEKRGVFKSWTILLAIAAFSFSLLGTFLVRSGVLTSVHAFANNPVRGTYILIFLSLVVGSSLLLFALRGSSVRVSGWFGLLSREVLFLVNNLLLVVVTFAILFGTLQPIIGEFMGWGRISVGAPYFNLMFNVLMTPLIFLIGLGPITAWRQQSAAALLRHSWKVLLLVLLLSLIGPWLLPNMGLLAKAQIGLALFLVLWLVVMTLRDLADKTVNRGRFRPTRVSASVYGMYLAHLGVAVIVVGIVLTSHMSTEKNVRLGPGDAVTVAGYTFRFESIGHISGPNYSAQRGEFSVSKNGQKIAIMEPEKRLYDASKQPMTEAAIDAGLSRDLYVALGEILPGSSDWAVRIYVKPFVRLIWLGGLLMALGALVALSDRRYRRKIMRRLAVKSTHKQVLEAN